MNDIFFSSLRMGLPSCRFFSAALAGLLPFGKGF